MSTRFPGAAGVLMLLLPAYAPAPAADPAVPGEPASAAGVESAVLESLTIENGDGRRFTFQVEIADTTAARRDGLMFRDRLEETRGMLFLYQPPQRVTMWMKNTLLPLDILFIDADGRIAGIVHDAEPLSERRFASPGRVRAVLEINGGMAAFLGLRSGDRVFYAPLWPEPP
jgi:hypothetical protein